MDHREYRWQTSDGVNLYGQTWSPAAPAQAAVALVHGLGDHSARYQHMAEFFSSCGIAVAAVDLRGHGRTEGIRGDIPSYDLIVKDLDLLLEKTAEQAPGKPLFLYGHSLGGSLALYYLLNRKPAISGLIASSPGLAAARVPRMKLLMVKVLDRVAPTVTVTNELDLTGLTRDTEVVQRYIEDPLVHDKVSARMALKSIQVGEWLLTQAGNLPEIPVLLLQGTSDRLIVPQLVDQFASQAGPQVTYKTWPGYYHELHNEPEKDAVLDFIRDWMVAHLPGSPA